MNTLWKISSKEKKEIQAFVFDAKFFDEKNKVMIYDSSEEDEFDDTMWELYAEAKKWMVKNAKKWDCFEALGHNMGWQHRSGTMFLQTDKWSTLIQKLLPNTSEISMTLYITWKVLWLKVSHHDAPTGEFYMVRPVTEKEYNKNT
jgi:hypothetical protein